MDTQKIVNLLNGTDNENSKFATRKWHVIDSESKGNYSKEDPIKFLTKSLESSLCDYSDAYILVTGNITVTGGNANTKVAFKNCALFTECRTEIYETFADETEHINIAMPMYNLIGYSDNYSDTSGSLWQFQRDKIGGDDNLTVNAQHIPDTSSSFKYKSSFITDKNGAKIAVPLKYLSKFWRSLEMSLINCKVELSLKWHKNCILSSAGTAATFAITDTKLYVPVVTLKTEDNVKLSKLLNEGFKRSVYWNKYKSILQEYAVNEYIRERLDASLPEINKLFVLAYAHGDNITDENSYRKYFLPRLTTWKLMEEILNI